MRKVCKWILIIALAGMVLYPIMESTATVRLVDTGMKPHYTGLSTDTKPTLAVRNVGATFREADTGRIYFWEGASWYVVNNSVSVEGDSLVAPGNFPAFSPKGFDEATIAFKLTAVNTSVALTIQGKIGTAAWENLYQADSLVVTANDSYYMTYSKCASLDSLRGYWLSEGGGTDAKIDVVHSLAKTKRGD
jgi:hypothetical protein